jgi:hypothetical protein
LAAVSLSSSGKLEERCASTCHSWDEQIPIEKQVSHLAARLGDEQTAVACRAVGGSVATAVVWLVVCADRIVRADCSAIKRAVQDVRKTRHCSHKTAQ